MNKPKSQPGHKKPKNNSQLNLSLAIKGPENCDNISDSHSQNSNNKDKISKKTRLIDNVKKASITDKIMATGTFVIAVATCLYTFFSFQQWGIMGKQMSLDQRAWVGIKNINTSKFVEGKKTVYLKEGQPFDFEAVIQNVGKTPARILTTKTYLLHEPSGTKPVMKESAIITSIPKPFTMFPGNEIELRLQVPTGHVYTEDQIARFKSGEYVLYYCGMIVYDDIFGKSHRTQFCQQLNTSLTAFNMCPFYNEAD